MSTLEHRWQRGLSRRHALIGLAGLVAGPVLAREIRDLRRAAALDQLNTASDFLPVFRERVPPAVYRHTMNGSDSEFTLRRNREAFDWVELVDRAPIDASVVNPATSLFGAPLDSPIIVAPTSRQQPLHPDGELGMYKAASAAQTPMIVSTNSSYPFDRIARAGTGTLWYQFYPRQNLERSRQILESVQTAGYNAIVVTIDQQVPLRLSHAPAAVREWTRQPLRRVRGTLLVRLQLSQRDSTDGTCPDACQGGPDRGDRATLPPVRRRRRPRLEPRRARPRLQPVEPRGGLGSGRGRRRTRTGLD